MTFLLSHRGLLRGMLAGAVVLTGTACSRSDRTESGSDTTAAMMPDTISVAQPSGAGTATEAMRDTAAKPAESSRSTQPASSDSVRGETAPVRHNDAAGYRSMERDTTSVPSQPADSALPDTSVSAVPSEADTATVETSTEAGDTTSIEMAGATDPTLTPDVTADTTATPSGDVALQTTVDTSSQDSASAGVETEVTIGADSADTAAADVAIAVDSADTVAADVAVSADSADTAVAEVAIAADSADTTDNAGRIRPPEDSTEINTEVARVRPPEDSTELLGDVTTPAEAADETADEQIITPEDEETVAASETRPDEVGAAAVGGITGDEAVALMTRGGVRCAVVDPEMNEAARWDMSSTPVTLNPCGMGSMILSRIWTER